MSDVSRPVATELAADLASFVKGRVLDDNAHVLLRFKGGLEWAQADPHDLWYTPFGEAKRQITRGGAGTKAAAARVTRMPPGHPEGYLEGFTTIYAEVARAITAARSGRKPDKDVSFPGIKDGVAGMAFIEACVKSSKANARWMRL